MEGKVSRPMAQLIPPGYAELTLIQTITGDQDPMICTFGLDTSGTPTPVQAGIIGRGLALRIGGEMANEWGTSSCVVRMGGEGAPGPVIEATYTAVLGQGGTSSPPNVAWLARKRTALGGRQNRGRNYFPGVPETAVSPAGLLVLAREQAMSVSLANWLNDVNTGTFSTGPGATAPAPTTGLVILHDELSGLVPTPVTSFFCDGRVATQRRRLRR